MKILHKIILGFFVIILLIWAVEYYSTNTSKKALKKSIEESSVLLAIKIMDEIDRRIYRRIEETQLYSKDLMLQKTVLLSNKMFEHLDDVQSYINKLDQEWTSVPKQTITPFMHQIINNDLSRELRARKEFYENRYGYPVFSEIIVTNKYGANIAQTGKTADYRQDDEKWWQQAKEERFYMHDIGYDESADIHSIDFGIRIDNQEGAFIGIMKAVLNIEELISIVRGPELSELQTEHTETKWKLIASDGRLIYSTGDYKFLSKIPDALLLNLKKERTGSFVAEDSGQIEKLFSFAHSNFRGLDWILIIEHDTKEIFAPIIKVRNGILIISLAVTVFAILAGLLFYNSVVKPVTKLRDAAIEIGKGNLDTKIEVKSRDEIGLLARTFSQMALNLAQDITERKRTENALRESEQKYRTLFEESKDVVYFSTPEGKFLDINPAGIELFGYSSKEELLKIDITNDLYINLADSEEFQQILLRQGFVKDYEVVFKRKDGQHVTILLNATVVHDEKGTITAYRGIMKDVTERKRLEQQLIQAQKMEAVGQLAGGIAHDFNNILTAIIGFGSIIKDETEKDEKLQSYAMHILTSAERAAKLTRALLAFSRKQVINPRPVNPNEIIKGLESLLLRLIGEDIELTTALTDKDLKVMADSSQIEQVLMNLATNAKDAMPDGGKMFITTKDVKLDNDFIKAHGYGRIGSYILISVEDTGHGMDEKTKEKIFEPFFTTKDVGRGTGLGLSMAYGIIKQHDGYINVYSEPGVGTTFNIYLPVFETKIEEIEEAELPILKRGRETVLIAEDDNHVRELTKEILAGFGYKVVEAADGVDAINRFKEHMDEIQLLILDVVMPKINGKEVYDAIKKVKPEVKAILMSGYASDMIYKKGILEKGLIFISKPVLPDELLRKVRDVLDE